MVSALRTPWWNSCPLPEFYVSTFQAVGHEANDGTQQRHGRESVERRASACQHSSPCRCTTEARKAPSEEAQWEDTHCYFHEGPELDEELIKETSPLKSAIEVAQERSLVGSTPAPTLEEQGYFLFKLFCTDPSPNTAENGITWFSDSQSMQIQEETLERIRLRDAGLTE